MLWLLFLLAAPIWALDKIALVWDPHTSSLDSFSSLIGTLKSTSQLDVDVFDVSNSTKVDLSLYPVLVVLPCKSKDTINLISSTSLLDFTNNGGNALIFNDDSGIHTELSYYLTQLGIHVSPKNYYYVDHHEPHLLSSLNKVILSESIHLSPQNASIALLTNNEHLIPLVQTTDSSKSTNGVDIWHLGKEGYLAAAFQALNNARTVWVGTSSPFVNESFDELFVKELIDWIGHAKGVIKAQNFKHEKVNEDESIISGYKVGDLMNFTVDLTQLEDGQWVPFQTEDVQLEFIMLDPYYRVNLNQKDGHYSTQIKLPDQHGIFTLKLDYKRPGYTYIDVEEVIPVRHLANDEYSRSWEIPNAWVYLNSYAVVVIAWFLFVVAYLLMGVSDESSESKKNK